MSTRNEAEPKPGSHVPTVLALLLAALLVLSVPWIFLRKTERRPAADVPVATVEMLEGQKVYQRNCIGCHEARGEGRPGQYPSLAGTSWLLDDKETPIRIMLLGVSGPMEVGGARYQNVMPNFGVTLTDEDIAHVLTFVRGSWGNAGSSILPEEVAKVRASLAGKVQPWSGGAALTEAKKTPVLR